MWLSLRRPFNYFKKKKKKGLKNAIKIGKALYLHRFWEQQQLNYQLFEVNQFERGYFPLKGNLVLLAEGNQTVIQTTEKVSVWNLWK